MVYGSDVSRGHPGKPARRRGDIVCNPGAKYPGCVVSHDNSDFKNYDY